MQMYWSVNWLLAAVEHSPGNTQSTLGGQMGIPFDCCVLKVYLSAFTLAFCPQPSWSKLLLPQAQQPLPQQTQAVLKEQPQHHKEARVPREEVSLLTHGGHPLGCPRVKNESQVQLPGWGVHPPGWKELIPNLHRSLFPSWKRHLSPVWTFSGLCEQDVPPAVSPCDCEQAILPPTMSNNVGMELYCFFSPQIFY